MHKSATKVWTLERLHSLPDDGNKYELVHGELLVTPAPSHDHEAIAARLSRILDRYAEANGLGFVFHPRAVIEYRGSQVEPDLMVRQLHAAHIRWDTAPLPTLVVEILSPSTSLGDRERKREFYIAELGIPDYWIVDPAERTVTHVRPRREDTTRADAVTWDPAGAPTPLSVDVARLFE